MIRFLLICGIFFILYLSFSAVSQLDSIVTFTVYDYFLETTLFTFIAFFILFLILAIIVLRIVFLFFEFPYLLRKKMRMWKVQKVTFALMNSMSYLLIGNRLKAFENIKKLRDDIKAEHKEIYNLIYSEVEDEFDQKIQLYRTLTSSKDYNYFAVKRLAEIFYENGFYEQSEEYATRAFNLNEFDSDILMVLIKCYAKLNLWTKFIFVVSKLSQGDSKKLSLNSTLIAEYYFQAAKYMLERGEDQDAMHYIEYSLELNPGYIEAIDLYYSLNLSLNKGIDNSENLKLAFAANPCFEMAELFIKASNLTTDRIYEELAEIVPPQENRGLFLAIAARLGLSEKIDGLKEQKLLADYT